MDEGIFVFVPGLQKTYSGSVRAHVLRRHIQKRKLRAVRRSSESESRHESQSPHQGEVQETTEPPLVLSMSAARTDPFRVFAGRSNPREDFLMDYYVSYFDTSAAGFFNPCRVCFTTNVTAEASFNAMCSFASRHLAIRTGASQTEALLYRVATFRSINQAIDNPVTRYADSTVLAIIGTIAFDQEAKYMYGSSDATHESETEFQLKGLRRILLTRGGFMAVAKNPAISWMVQWYDLMNSGKLSTGTTPLSVHAFLPPSRLDVKNGGIKHLGGLVVDDKMIRAEEFVGIYGSFYRTASERSGLRLADDAFSRLLGKGTLIWEILAKSSLLHEHTRKMIALVYLNLTIAKCQDLLDMLWLQFSKRVSSAMIAFQSDSRNSTITALLVVLLTDMETGQMEDSERVWTTARFLNVYDKLSEALQARLENALMQFLAAESESKSEDVLTSDVLREQVMDELATETDVPARFLVTL